MKKIFYLLAFIFLVSKTFGQENKKAFSICTYKKLENVEYEIFPKEKPKEFKLTQTVKDADNSTVAGFLNSPEARAIGSQNGVVAADYKKQITDLLTSGPHEFSGTFGEALKELAIKGTAIKNSETVDKPKTAGIIGAVNKGIAEWTATITGYFPAANRPAEVTQILANLASYTQQLTTIQTCLAPTPPPTSPTPSGTANALPSGNKTKQPNTNDGNLNEQKLGEKTEQQNSTASASTACPSPEDGQAMEELYGKIEDGICQIEVLNEKNKPVWETDGHYSTVFLILLKLGMPLIEAEKIANASEDPDTDINFKTGEYIMDDTWANGALQKIYHSLNGGFHGVEEIITAISILGLPNDNVKRIGEMIHRYGDTYAHTRLKSANPNQLNDLKIDEIDISDGINEIESAQLTKLMNAWKNVSSGDIINNIPDYIKFINLYISKNGENYSNEEFGKAFYHYNLGMAKPPITNISRYISEIHQFPLTRNGHLKLYGNEEWFMTFDHFNSDGPNADFIFIRPDWYLSYVKNLAGILKYKYSLNVEVDEEFMSVFKKMTSYVNENKCSMRGIIDAEIALFNNAKSVRISRFKSIPSINPVLFDKVFGQKFF